GVCLAKRSFAKLNLRLADAVRRSERGFIETLNRVPDAIDLSGKTGLMILVLVPSHIAKPTRGHLASRFRRAGPTTALRRRGQPRQRARWFSPCSGRRTARP